MKRRARLRADPAKVRDWQRRSRRRLPPVSASGAEASIRAATQARVDAKCEQCGRRFWRYASQVRARGAPRYCSRACKDAASVRRVVSVCRQCGQEFDRPRNVFDHPGRGKFCSRPCYAAAKREDRTRRVALVCSTCGREFERAAAHARLSGPRWYCSRPCASEGRRRGPSLPRRGKAWRELAERIRELDGRRCVRCGTDEDAATKAGRLNVDHVIPARMLIDWPDAADHPTNLASLCPACHAVKTHRFEPRILRGDFLAIEEFYGRDVRLAVMELFAEPERAAERRGLRRWSWDR